MRENSETVVQSCAQCALSPSPAPTRGIRSVGTYFASVALIVAAVLPPDLWAAPNPPTLFYQSAATHGHTWLSVENHDSASPAQRPSLPNGLGVLARSRREVDRPGSRPVRLSYSQKHALLEAWRAGYHVGLPLAFTAVIYVESKACADARKSSKGAVGCAQVLPQTANEVAKSDIPEWQLSSTAFPEESMAIGAHYLQECIDKFGWPAGIGCYDYGLHAKLTRRQLARLRYTRAVLAAMRWLKQLPVSED